MALPASTIQALSTLLQNNDEASSEDEDKPTSVMTPGQIGPKKLHTKPESKTKNSKDIWDEAEVEDEVLVDDSLDPRPRPDYEIIFKQKVTSEDMFLGMSGKDQSTACCEDLVVKIKFPDTKYADVSLNVTDKSIDCSTARFRLATYLPKQVDSNNGRARWLADEATLEVTFPVVSEFDFLYK